MLPFSQCSTQFLSILPKASVIQSGSQYANPEASISKCTFFSSAMISSGSTAPSTIAASSACFLLKVTESASSLVSCLRSSRRSSMRFSAFMPLLPKDSAIRLSAVSGVFIWWEMSAIESASFVLSERSASACSRRRTISSFSSMLISPSRYFERHMSSAPWRMPSISSASFLKCLWRSAAFTSWAEITITKAAAEISPAFWFK